MRGMPRVIYLTRGRRGDGIMISFHSCFYCSVSFHHKYPLGTLPVGLWCYIVLGGGCSSAVDTHFSDDRKIMQLASESRRTSILVP